MTPKEKAKDLINKFRLHSRYWDCRNDEPLEENHAKQCALIAVNEVILANPHSNPLNTDVYSTMDYWQQIKQEIEKL
jgi:HEPN domain-containing protein